MTKFYLVVQNQKGFTWKLVDTLETENTTDWRFLANKFIKKLGLDATANREGEFLNDHNLYLVATASEWERNYSKKVANHD